MYLPSSTRLAGCLDVLFLFVEDRMRPVSGHCKPHSPNDGQVLWQSMKRS